MPQISIKEGLERNCERIRVYLKETLTRKFHIPVIPDEEVIRAIALKLLVGGSANIWLNGEAVNLEDIEIHMELCIATNKSKSPEGLLLTTTKE